jgi:signal transduction histidine kinase
VQQLAVAHMHPPQADLVREVFRRFPAGPASPHGHAATLRAGRAVVAGAKDVAALEAAAATDPEYGALLRALAPTSWIVVPLVVQGRVAGALALALSVSRRCYGAADVALAQDLAQRVASAIDRARLYRELEQASRTKDEFLATVSHELRTPLNAILGWTRMLRGGALSAEKRERALETVERNARAQTQLIDDLLDVSRIVSGKLRLDMRTVEPIRVVEAALDAVRPSAEAKSIQLQLALDPAAGPLHVDPDRLQQIVWNLLTNAVKFTPRGGRVQVVLRRVGSSVEIEVTDSGQGISPEFLPHVFERFRQADGSTSRSHGGLGLGLAIVRHLVELHGGAIRAESPGEGRGATFVVQLPIAALRVEVAALTLSAAAPASAGVSTAANAAEGFAALTRERPDVLVSDVGMPGEDGCALIARIRELSHADGGATPAIALTALARAEDRKRAMLAGYDTHVAKPIDPTELAVVVAKLVDRDADPTE